jgi:hypothetical protein
MKCCEYDSSFPVLGQHRGITSDFAAKKNGFIDSTPNFFDYLSLFITREDSHAVDCPRYGRDWRPMRTLVKIIKTIFC